MKIWTRILFGMLWLTFTPALLFMTIFMIGAMLYYRIAWGESFKEQWDDCAGEIVTTIGKMFYWNIVKLDVYIPFTEQTEGES